MFKKRFVSPDQKKLFSQIMMAVWTCIGLEALVLFSIWQGLPVVGTRFNALVVGVMLLIWLGGLAAYRLTFGRRQLVAYRRKHIYQNYLP